MTDEEIRAAAREHGYELEERRLRGADTWTWRYTKRPDDGQPCFLTEREAFGYMEDRLRHIGAFT